MKRVLVVLAAYNGQDWIEEQLDSILGQKNVLVDIFCSVDLSTDKTFEIVSNYTDRRVSVLSYGKRFGGAGPNFYRLIRDVDFSGYDYVALADQDDIWQENKLDIAIQELLNTSSDGLSSDVRAFWSDGRSKKLKKSFKQTKYDFFFESPGPGCSFVLNKKLACNIQAFIKNTNEESLIDLHDWLIYAYARSNGFLWHISKKDRLLYRQHENNQCGANFGISGILDRLKIMRQGWYSNQVIKLFKLFDPDSNILIRMERNNFFDRVVLSLLAHKFRRKTKEKCLLSFAFFLNLL